MSEAVASEIQFDELLSRSRNTIEEFWFQEVQKWKEQTGGKAIGHFPVYSPMELIYANGMLPVGIVGAGNTLEIERADALFGSFACSIVKTTTELALRGKLKCLDGIFFHSICDAARNLAFVFKGNFSSDLVIEYIHYPQNPSSPAAQEYLVHEFGRVQKTLEKLSGRPMQLDDLRRSIEVFNENRRLIHELYRIRKETPHLLTAAEGYQLIRTGYYMPPEEHSDILRKGIAAIAKRQVKARDQIRVVVEGSFCEQPPLEWLQILDEAGCAVVNDDLLLGRRWFEGDVPVDGDPIRSLAESYLNRANYSSVAHDWRRNRYERLVEKVKNSGAAAVVFCIAKFCEPALIDYPVFKKFLERENIPHILLEFEEKMWTFSSIRDDLATFVESIIFD